MRKIRKLYFFDKKNVQEMISFLNNCDFDNYINHIMFNPLILLHHFLPLKFKFLPESYVLKEDKNFLGLITVSPKKMKNIRIEIQKLFFEEGAYEDAMDLIQYVVSKYKSMGAISFIVKVDDYLPDLLRVFISKCNFSQISFEKIWRINKIHAVEYNKKRFRKLRDKDVNQVINLYNDFLLPHFRPLLNKDKSEFSEPLFNGLSCVRKMQYVMEDDYLNIIAYFSIKTYDNENYILEIVQDIGVEIDINAIISYANEEIRKNKKRFGLFIKTKKYTQLGEKYDYKFIENKYECVQNQIVLTNSSAKIMRKKEEKCKFVVLNQFCNKPKVNVINCK